MKADAEDIRQFLDELAAESWLGRARAEWTKYAFHFSELRNAVEILKSGRVKSRASLERDDLLPVDIACHDIISQTDEEIRASVRLYFRPLTPTQYHMEGFRPSTQISKNSHCRVPVFFLFDSREILCRDDSSFSEVNLAAYGTRRQLVTTARDLRKFNFKDIYHDSPCMSSRVGQGSI